MIPYIAQLFKCHEIMQYFKISNVLSKWKLFSPHNFFKFELSHLDSLIFFFTGLITIQLIKRKITSKLALIYFNVYNWWLALRNFRRIFIKHVMQKSIQCIKNYENTTNEQKQLIIS